MGLSQHYPSENMQVQTSHKGNLRRNYADLLTSKKTTLSADDYTNSNHPLNTITDAAQHLAGKTCSANLTVPKRITAFKWLTNSQLNFLDSISRTEHSHKEDWHRDSVVPYQPFRVSSVNTYIQPANVQYMLMILALPPTFLSI